jgi:ATP-binding cassette subfamily C (CFTR/MRP) protein 1
MGVFGRDFDVIDNTLPESLRNVIITVANVIGSIILITVFEHYFIIVGSKKTTTVSCAKAN